MEQVPVKLILQMLFWIKNLKVTSDDHLPLLLEIKMGGEGRGLPTKSALVQSGINWGQHPSPSDLPSLQAQAGTLLPPGSTETGVDLLLWLIPLKIQY